MLLCKDIYVLTEEYDSSLPSIVVFLLHEFQVVLLEKILSGLPPIKGIERQINFIPSSNIPNLPTYRSNPGETKEIQRQVEALLGKGWVQESMSPNVVPVLLMPKKDSEWQKSTNCWVINAIIVKYYHPIPRLNNMLDELYGMVISSKIDLKSWYHQI